MIGKELQTFFFHPSISKIFILIIFSGAVINVFYGNVINIARLIDSCVEKDQNNKPISHHQLQLLFDIQPKCTADHIAIYLSILISSFHLHYFLVTTASWENKSDPNYI